MEIKSLLTFFVMLSVLLIQSTVKIFNKKCSKLYLLQNVNYYHLSRKNLFISGQKKYSIYILVHNISSHRVKFQCNQCNKVHSNTTFCKRLSSHTRMNVANHKTLSSPGVHRKFKSRRNSWVRAAPLHYHKITWYHFLLMCRKK